MSGICFIVGAGDFNPVLLPQKQKNDILIAADGGYSALQSARIVPDICIGDFDSLGFVPSGCETVKLPLIKNETDMGAAALLGLERGYADFVFFGVLGGRRFSHSIAAIQTLARLKERGVYCKIIDECCEVTALKNEMLSFAETMSGYISIFAVSDNALVTLSGLSYPLTSYTLTNKFPLGVSNSFTGQPASVTVEKGLVIVVTENRTA